MTKKAVRSLIKNGTKLEKLYEYLKKEIVGEDAEMLFTKGHVNALLCLLDTKKPEAVWNMLSALAKKKLITKTKKKGEAGLTIKLGNKAAGSEETGTGTETLPTTTSRVRRVKVEKPSRGRGRSLTVPQLIKKIRSDISGLKTEIEELGVKQSQLAEQIRQKEEMIANLNEMSRR